MPTGPIGVSPSGPRSKTPAASKICQKRVADWPALMALGSTLKTMIWGGKGVAVGAAVPVLVVVGNGVKVAAAGGVAVGPGVSVAVAVAGVPVMVGVGVGVEVGVSVKGWARLCRLDC